MKTTKTPLNISRWAVSLLALLTLTLSLTSCQDVIDPSTIGNPNSTPRLVVDALLTDKSDTQIVRLTWSQNYFNNDEPKPVTGAVVTVRERNASVDREVTLAEIPGAPGYYAVNNMRVQEQTNYLLRIAHDGQVYTAASFAPRRIQWVQTPGFQNRPTEGRYDTLFFQFRNPINQAQDSGYAAQLRIADTRGVGDAYRIYSYKNGRLLNRPTNINTYEDDFVLDGRNFPIPIVEQLNPDFPDKPLQPNDTLTVDIHCIEPLASQYWLSVRQQTNNGGLFARPPANVPCNITNENQNGPKALGWFSAATTLQISAIVKPGINTVRLR